ncbi:hypothetical protein [Pandoraea sp. NPDC087047]|uniref:hypothetical protein n=1 Tax=Pandoraea sp. NPDC087047 TaxID=3364390 RepID=UPI003807867D
MDLNACPFLNPCINTSSGAAAPPRDDLLPEAGPLGTFGAVIGHDGSGAPLPGIGPYDFSAATRVPDAVPPDRAGNAVRMSLTQQAHASQYVVKACPSAWHAAQAWLASRLFGALGLATPTAILVKGCSQAFDGTQAPERIYLATTYLPVYRHLGDWLEGDAAWRVIEGSHDDPIQAASLERTRADAREAGQQMANVLAQAGHKPFPSLEGAAARAYAEALRRRNDTRGVLCGALPAVYQCALERQYVAALWLGNRDLCNVFMENIGVWRDKNDLPCMMTVDFDTCLDLGLQGTLKDEGHEVALGQRQCLASLSSSPSSSPSSSSPALRSTFRRDAACFGATLPPGALADLTQFPYGEHYAPFVRRLAGLARDVPNRTVLDELKNPTSVRALAAEMAYRLGRISAQEVRPWVESARDVAGGESSAAKAPLRDSEAFVNHLLTRRDSLVQLLGGTWAAQAWAHAYPMRARAIDAQQEPFGHQAGA